MKGDVAQCSEERTVYHVSTNGPVGENARGSVARGSVARSAFPFLAWLRVVQFRAHRERHDAE